MNTRKVPASAPESHRPDFVSSLAKGLEILAAFEHGDMLGNQELVARTGLPKTTVSRLTGTLASLGYLRLDERTRKYAMGTRVLGMGASLQRHIGLQRVARPFMDDLANQLDVTVILGARDREKLTFLELIRPVRYQLDVSKLTVNTDIGSVVSLESTALGQACLVAAPTAERIHVLENLRRKHPDDWESVRKRIEQAHNDYQKFGFVISQNSGPNVVSGVSVPLVLGAKGVYAFGCAGPAFELPLPRLTEVLGPGLVEMVRKIRDKMSSLDAPANGTKRTSISRS